MVTKLLSIVNSFPLMLSTRSRVKHALSRAATIGIVVIVIIIIAAGGFLALANKATSTTSTTSTTSSSTQAPPTTSSSSSSVVSSTSSSSSFSSSSSSSVSSSSSSSSSSTSTSSSSQLAQSLTLEDFNWPIDDMNVLYEPTELPWPQWYAFAVYQTMVDVNLGAEYGQGVIQYLPGLASNWTINSASTYYNFTLRQNVNFSNGDPFNAYQYWMEMYGFYYLSGNSSAWMESYDIFNMTG